MERTGELGVSARDNRGRVLPMSCRAVFVVLDRRKGWGSLVLSVVRNLVWYDDMELVAQDDADKLPSEPRLRRAVGCKGEESRAEVNVLSAVVGPPRCA